MRRQLRLPVLVAVLALVLGCSRASVPEGSEQGGPEVPEASAEVSEELEETVVGPHGRLALSGWVGQDYHSFDGDLMGTLLLRGVEVDDWGNVFLEVEASTRRSVRFGVTGVTLVDDLGNTYPWVRPEGEGRESILGMSGNQRMFARLGFVGPVDPGAQRFDVQFNEPDDPVDSNFKYRFEDVPFPGVGLESEATGDGGDVLDGGSWEVDLSTVMEGASGVEVQVHSVEISGVRTVVDVTVVNGSQNEIYLPVTMRDDAGTLFRYERGDREDSEQGLSHQVEGVRISSGFEADWTLVFRRTPANGASMLVLEFNTAQEGHERRPTVRIEIPIPE